MRIYKAKDYVDMSRKAANIVSAQVIIETKLCSGACNRIYSDRSL